MNSLMQRVWWWITGTGPWFSLKYPDVGELIGQRDWKGNLWVTARDGVYEIRFKLSAVDADKILAWLRDTGREFSKHRKLRVVDTSIKREE